VCVLICIIYIYIYIYILYTPIRVCVCVCVCERADDRRMEASSWEGQGPEEGCGAIDGWITYTYIYNAYIDMYIYNAYKYIFRNESPLFSTVQTNRRTITVSPQTSQTQCFSDRAS